MDQYSKTVPVFVEVQKFRQRTIWVLIVIAAAWLWVAMIAYFLPGQHIVEITMPFPVLLLLWLLVGVGLPAIFLFGNLRIALHGDGVYVRFWPFHFSDRMFPFTEIKKCEAREYNALKEYGGWGIKCGKGGRSYSVKGNRGVQLELADGDRVLLGSERADELATAIRARLTNRP